MLVWGEECGQFSVHGQEPGSKTGPICGAPLGAKSNEYGELLRGKIVDLAVTLSGPLIQTTHVINRLAASTPKLQRTSNASDYSPLCYEPVVLSIETKCGSKNDEVQLSL